MESRPISTLSQLLQLIEMNYQNFGLFAVPIRFNQSTNIYPDYLDFLSNIERFGYTHVFVGEHLTDEHEDIQSSMIFASAILARTKKLKVALSVLPLTHYNIPLLVKQLEDLYKLSDGRLMIGFSPGALNSDLEYLGITPNTRSSLFCEKLEEFKAYINKSDVLSKIPPSSFFSTLLSPFPVSASKLQAQGFSALSSNFTHSSYLQNHSQCFFANERQSIDNTNWNLAVNLVEDYAHLSAKSKLIILQSVEYIYKKLSVNANKIMLGPQYEDYDFKSEEEFSHLLLKEQIYDLIGLRSILRKIKFNETSILVFNLFDCLDDSCYTSNILKIPSLLG